MRNAKQLIVAAVLFGGLVSVPNATHALAASAARQAWNSGAAAAVHDRNAIPADVDAFLGAAALDATSVPGDMSLLQQGSVSVSDVAQGNPDAAALLQDVGFVQAYAQGFRTNNAGASILGAPAGAGDLIAVFTDAAGASSWNQFEQQNASSFGGQQASAQGVTVDITDSTPWDLSGLGDESSAVELHGTATIAGFTADVYIELGLVRRGRVQYTAVVVGLAPQRSALSALAGALDMSVASALPLLNQ